MSWVRAVVRPLTCANGQASEGVAVSDGAVATRVVDAVAGGAAGHGVTDLVLGGRDRVARLLQRRLGLLLDHGDELFTLRRQELSALAASRNGHHGDNGNRQSDADEHADDEGDHASRVPLETGMLKSTRRPPWRGGVT